MLPGEQRGPWPRSPAQTHVASRCPSPGGVSAAQPALMVRDVLRGDGPDQRRAASSRRTRRSPRPPGRDSRSRRSPLRRRGCRRRWRAPGGSAGSAPTAVAPAGTASAPTTTATSTRRPHPPRRAPAQRPAILRPSGRWPRRSPTGRRPRRSTHGCRSTWSRSPWSRLASEGGPQHCASPLPVAATTYHRSPRRCRVISTGPRSARRCGCRGHARPAGERVMVRVGRTSGTILLLGVAVGLIPHPGPHVQTVRWPISCARSARLLAALPAQDRVHRIVSTRASTRSRALAGLQRPPPGA